jgi:hypothetical protein
MRSLVLAFFLLLIVIPSAAQVFYEPPDVPATAPNPEFPVRVHILGSHWNYVRGSYRGYGRGDLLGDNPVGFDYTYSCSQPFLHNALREEFYQARWKKQDQKLEILTQKVGSDHFHHCELKVALKPVPYMHYKANDTAGAATK